MRIRSQRKRRAKNKRRPKENRRKSTTATVPVTPPTAVAVIVTVDRTQAATRRAKRRRRVRRKHPAAIAAQRDKPRVRKGHHRLTGAGHQVRKTLTGGLRKTLAITDKQRQRREGAGVGVESVRERTRGKTNITAETGRGTEVAQMERDPKQQIGGVGVGVRRKERARRTGVEAGVGAGRGRRTGKRGVEAGVGARRGRRTGVEAGVEADREEKKAMTETKENTDSFSAEKMCSSRLARTVNSHFPLFPQK